MKISEILKNRSPAISFEFFPPKTKEGLEKLWQTIDKLKAFSPEYISVTYGAGGSTREKTIELVTSIKKRTGLEPMAHLTCVGSSCGDIHEILESYQKEGIENILALRGDAPQENGAIQEERGDFAYANELVREIKEHYSFSVGVAAYPEIHPEAADWEDELRALQLKAEAGADFVVTQLFFNNDDFYRFRDRVEKAGISLPLVPGILPISNYSQIQRFTKLCGAKIPVKLGEDLAIIEKDLEAVEKYGTEFAIQQCRNLIDNGVPGLHFYTLNKSKNVSDIVKGLSLEQGS